MRGVPSPRRLARAGAFAIVLCGPALGSVCTARASSAGEAPAGLAGEAPAGLAGEAPAGALPSEAPARLYDRPGVSHNSQCLQTVAGASVPVRDLQGHQLQTAAGPVVDPPEARETCAARAGVRLEGIEAVRAGALTLYYSWPFEGGAQASGFIAAGQLVGAPSLVAADAAGNGAPAPAAVGEPLYAIAPEDIASVQRYRGPGGGRWYTYSVYGRPLGAAAFALMSWSWVDVLGGGIARAAVSEGELFHPARVQAITLASAPAEGAPPDGSVTARYGFVQTGSERLYGWMVSSHTFEGLCYDNMAYAGGGPPLAATLCPEGALADSIGDRRPWG